MLVKETKKISLQRHRPLDTVSFGQVALLFHEHHDEFVPEIGVIEQSVKGSPVD